MEKHRKETDAKLASFEEKPDVIEFNICWNFWLKNFYYKNLFL